MRTVRFISVLERRSDDRLFSWERPLFFLVNPPVFWYDKKVLFYLIQEENLWGN